MARKLKIYQTSLGFYDLAVAAPSMKAALEAWGAGSNLFHQGFAREADDPKSIAAAMAKPGIIVKRPVGTNETFSENAHLPTSLPQTGATITRRAKRTGKPDRKPPAAFPPAVDDKETRKAAAAFAKEQRCREQERKREEAAADKARQIRQRAVADAEAALEEGRQKHASVADEIEKERDTLDKRAEKESARWEKRDLGYRRRCSGRADKDRESIAKRSEKLPAVAEADRSRANLLNRIADEA